MLFWHSCVIIANDIVFYSFDVENGTVFVEDIYSFEINREKNLVMIVFDCFIYLFCREYCISIRRWNIHIYNWKFICDSKQKQSNFYRLAFSEWISICKIRFIFSNLCSRWRKIRFHSNIFPQYLLWFYFFTISTEMDK